MGCYHFHLNQLSRGKGQSAIASAAYRAGAKLECTYYGEVSDYTRKGGVVLAEIHLPKQAPERLEDRETLWNEVEWIEGNKKAQLAHSFDIALMNEFSMEENIELARRFVEEQLVARGMIADLAIHDPKKAKDKIPNPHMHIMVPIRPLKEDGTWGQKQKKVPVLTPDGQPVLNQKGQLVFRAVHTTDWSRKETLEELRSAWAKMCNELYEEKGLTERVDARSYEERGIDKIPMVHEGPNVQAMEARGISTALGSLNRLIRALNDMKERAKNLLQWSLLRQSQLMERMLFLHQPTLADYLRNYYDKRNAVAESYAYGTQKAKNTNLKQFAETIRFLEEQDVRTPEQLTEKIQEFDTQLNEVSQRLKKQLAALQRVNVNLYAMKEYFDILGSSALLIGGSGSGSVTKLANQVIVNNTIAVVSEAFVLATKAGADPEKVYHAIRGGLAGSAVLDAKIPMIIERNFKPGGPIRINHKDIKNVVNTAHSIDVPIPYTAQLYEILQTLKIHGHMNDDHGGIVQYFEKLADVEVKKTEE